MLENKPNYIVEIQAHTDSKGSQEYNEKLSERRAESAKRYLVKRGIAKDRIRTTWFGEINPVAKNELEGGTDTEQGRQFNRRVEFRFYDQQDVQVDNSEYIFVPFDLLVPDAKKMEPKIISAQRSDDN